MKGGGITIFFIGNKIRDLRDIHELRQKYMAKEFSVSENTWSQYETNKRIPSLETIKKVAEFFNVSVDYLLDLTTEKYNPKEAEFQEIIKIYVRLSTEQKKQLLLQAEKII